MPPTIILEFELIAKLVLVIKNCWKDVIPQTPTHPQQSCQKFIKTFVKWQQCDSLFCNAILLKCYWNEIFVSYFIRSIYSFKRA